MPRIKLLALTVFFAFLIVGVSTLKDYGISWDEPIHFTRGQAYLHYFLTGELKYKTLTGQRSYFQDNNQNAEFFLQNDSGHPPTNDIMAAFFNYVFYQKLKIMGDIQSFHLFNVLASALLVLVVTVFSYQTMGLLPSIISALVISTYPLFFAESHFNIKDPPQAAFYTLTIWLLWLSLKKFNWKLLLLAGISFGLSVGMKFNILFLPVFFLPYLLIRYFPLILKKKIKLSKISWKYYLVLFLLPVIVIAIFFVFWPYLWQDPLKNIMVPLKYYKDIGIGGILTGRFALPFGLNAYPIIWIFFTTPPLVLLLTTIGIISVFLKRKNDEKTEFLWLLWFIVPILRVTLPKTVIYGGVRQIMEFVPAMALLAGLGSQQIINFVEKKLRPKSILVVFVVILFFLPHFIVLAKLHPNENVYFNSLIGGLAGAQKANIPYWGNSFGNAYYQAVEWLNKNLELNSKLALVQGTSTNIPKIQLRSDINFSNSLWSGIERKGEYLLELTHDDSVKYYPYVWDYIDKFLEPVYEVKVEGVAIAKVWKNDILHTKIDMKKSEVKYPKQIDLKIEANQLTIDLGSEQNVSRIIIKHLRQENCSKTTGFIEVKKENGEWIREKEAIPFPQIVAGVEDSKFTYYFPGRILKMIKFTSTTPNPCALINPSVEVYILK